MNDDKNAMSEEEFSNLCALILIELYKKHLDNAGGDKVVALQYLKEKIEEVNNELLNSILERGLSHIESLEKMDIPESLQTLQKKLRESLSNTGWDLKSAIHILKHISEDDLRLKTALNKFMKLVKSPSYIPGDDDISH